MNFHHLMKLHRIMTNKYYVYAYLRTDNTPYYIGKGCGDRINSKNHPGISLPPINRRVKLYANLSNDNACNKEMELILEWGRKDLETGLLYNRTNGGENPPIMTKNNPNHIKGVQNYWNNVSKEKKLQLSQKVSKSKRGKGNHLPTKSVKIVELNIIFLSIRECAKYIKGDPSAITRCLNKRGQYKHRGYSFERII